MTFTPDQQISSRGVKLVSAGETNIEFGDSFTITWVKNCGEVTFVPRGLDGDAEITIELPDYASVPIQIKRIVSLTADIIIGN